jgi:hypothetical protein
MTMEHFDDETLMAFADGELDPATSQRLETALETDDALAHRLAVFLDTRMAVASAMKPLINEPMPEALVASVRRMAEAADARAAGATEDNVVPFRRAEKPAAARPGQPWLMPVAASILAIVTGVGGYMAGRGSIDPENSPEIALSGALDRQPSGGDVALGQTGVLHIVSSFIDGRGELCREYELKRPDETTATVACRSNGAWVTRLALSSPRAEGYVPASSQETIDAYLASIQAGEPLSVEAEKNALADKAK